MSGCSSAARCRAASSRAAAKAIVPTSAAVATTSSTPIDSVLPASGRTAALSLPVAACVG